MFKNTPPLAILPSRIVTDRSIGDAAIRTLIALAAHCNQDRLAWPSVKSLAEKLGKSVRAVQNDLKALEDGEYIKREAQFRNGQQVQNRYRVFFDSPIGGGEAELQGGGEAELQGGGEAVLHTEQNHLTIKKKKGFLDFVSEEYKGDPIAKEQAAACWDYWEANNKFPEGCYKAAFRGWLRKGKSLSRPDRAPSQQKPRDNTPKTDNTGTSADASTWRRRLEGFAKSGFWVGAWGGRPDGSDGRCYAPADLLKEYGFKQERKLENA